jgi:acyl-CoA thioesterase
MILYISCYIDYILLILRTNLFNDWILYIYKKKQVPKNKVILQFKIWKEKQDNLELQDESNLFLFIIHV